MATATPTPTTHGDSRTRGLSFKRRGLLVLLVVGLFLGVMLLGLWSSRPAGQGFSRWVTCDEQLPERWKVREGDLESFHFARLGDRVLVTNPAAFNFGANQDFSVAAWIQAYPAASRHAQRIQTWMNARPTIARRMPRKFARWLAARAADNDFGVMPIVDKHQPRSTSEAVGFQLYLDYGRLACQLAAPPLRPLGFQNFVSPAPNLQDGRWHHIAVTVERNSATGGRLYVDGRQVLTFDPTSHSGDLSNSEPLRIGNHANPGLNCYFKGTIAGVTAEHRALSAEAVAAQHRTGRPR